MSEAHQNSNELQSQRQAFYDELDPLNMAPLWEVLAGLVTPEPNSPAVTAKWSFDEARDYLLRAGDLITAEEAERRVLILENPALRGQSAITRTLYAGLQLVLPGEIAAAHRHTQSALRFIMSGAGAYTAVNGERAIMNRFDLVLTPNWHWHDHGNDTDEPMIWLDGLDIPLLLTLDASFAEGRDEGAVQDELRPAGDNIRRYGGNMRPVSGSAGDVSPTHQPLFHYPFKDWSQDLRQTAETGTLDPHFGIKMEFINPATAGPVMPTISAFSQFVPKGFKTKRVQSTDGAVHVLCEGKGKAKVGDVTYDLAPREIFVVPAWSPLSFEATDDMTLFSFSDKAVQEKLSLWRERKH